MAWTTPGTATAGEVLTAAFWNEQVRDNLTELAPLANEWISWTPTWTNVTVGNGTVEANYVKTGKTLSFSLRFVLGNTSAVTGNAQFSLPFANAQTCPGYGWIDVAGTSFATIVIIAGSSCQVRAINTAGTYAASASTSATIPATWAADSAIYVSATYETT